MSRKVAYRGGRERSATGGGSARAPARVLPGIFTVSWVVCLFGSTVAGGCPRFSLRYALCLAVVAAALVAEILLLRATYRRDSLLPAFRKLTGYAIVAQYVAQAVSRAEWVNAGLIDARRAAVLYALILVCTAVGACLFVLLGRKGVRAAFGYVTGAARTRRARRGPVRYVLEWADSLASVGVWVILINTFVFQLYAVPTESMVPVFLKGDRPVAIKVTAGPRLPLTEYRFPFLRKPAVGDIVTIANPRYPDNSTVSPRRYLSQLLYTVTLTKVNIDKTAPDGSARADPLVKRIVAVPGEQIMMVDDVLYVRTAAEPDFRPAPGDHDGYAQVDLWKLPASVKPKVEYVPVDRAAREILDAWDARKNAADPTMLAREVLDITARVRLLLAAMPETLLSEVEARELRADPRLAERRRDVMLAAAAPGSNPIADAAAAADDLALALALGRSPVLLDALERYASGAAGSPAGATSYERGSRALNLLIKLNVLARIERNLALIGQGLSLRAVGADEERAALIQEAQELHVYLNRFYDARNFPEFPAGERFLGEDEYFAMGDNRGNSLDFRFSSQARLRALDPGDPESVRYLSAIAPFALKRQFIESFAVLRVWPFSRLGVLR